MAESCSDTGMLTANAPVTLERSKSVQMDAPYSLGNLIPVLLFYHPTMKSLAERITERVQALEKDGSTGVINHCID